MNLNGQVHFHLIRPLSALRRRESPINFRNLGWKMQRVNSFSVNILPRFSSTLFDCPRIFSRAVWIWSLLVWFFIVAKERTWKKTDQLKTWLVDQWFPYSTGCLGQVKWTKGAASECRDGILRSLSKTIVTIIRK